MNPGERTGGSDASGHYLGDRGAEYHRAYSGIFELRVEATLRALVPHLRVTDRVLDFGCADGSLLAALENPQKLGVEINPASRDVARGRGLEVFDRMEPIGDSSVDLVVSSHVLEHTLRPLDELASMGRVLRPGGKLVLMLPIDDWRTQRRWVLPETNHHLYTWTPQLIANLLSEAGFEVASIRVLTYTLPGRFSVRLHRALPGPVFDAVARFTAVVRRRRQLVAVATVP